MADYVAPARDDAALDEAESAEGRSSDIGNDVGNIACRPAARARFLCCRFFVGTFLHRLHHGIAGACWSMIQIVNDEIFHSPRRGRQGPGLLCPACPDTALAGGAGDERT